MIRKSRPLTAEEVKKKQTQSLMHENDGGTEGSGSGSGSGTGTVGRVAGTVVEGLGENKKGSGKII